MTCAPLPARLVQGFTIDASTSTDLDDAIWVQCLPDGGWRTWVTIAAAGAAVLPGSLEDQEARARVETRYFATGHKSMLAYPTEKRLSLLPYRKRDGLTIELDVDASGEVQRSELYPSRIESIAQLSHVEIPGMLAGVARMGRVAVLKQRDHLEAAHGLALKLLARRRRRGTMALYDLRHGWALGEDGHVRPISPDRSTIGYVIVQELMVLANAEMAKFARANDVPILYRTHAVRGAGPDRAALLADLEAAQVDEQPDVAAIAGRVEHLLERARYSATPAPHWGLALDLYTHLTSPIRRYADLVSQRQLLAFVCGEPLPHTTADLEVLAEHINRTLTDRQERAAARKAEQANAAGEATLAAASAEALSRLDDTRFERVLKVAARSGQDCPEVLRAAFVERLAAGRMPLLCMMVAMVESPPAGTNWGLVREAALVHLVKHPELAPSILQIATSLGLLPEVERETWQPLGQQGPFVSTSRVNLAAGERRSAPMTASKKKVSAALADVALLAALRELPMPAGAMMAPPERPLPAKALPRIDPAKSPISMLNELMQATRSAPPVFVVAQEAAQFRCECRFVIHMVGGAATTGAARGDGASKAEAKATAAREALRFLVAAGVVDAPEKGGDS